MKHEIHVDIFCVKYTSAKDAHHIVNALQDLYKITINWKGEHYIGVDLKLDYELCTCKLSVKGYTSSLPSNASALSNPDAWTRLPYILYAMDVTHKDHFLHHPTSVNLPMRKKKYRTHRGHVPLLWTSRRPNSSSCVKYHCHIQTIWTKKEL